jgi:hypothetical protein
MPELLHRRWRAHFLDAQLLFFVYSTHPEASSYHEIAEIKGMSLEEAERVIKDKLGPIPKEKS